MWDRRQYQKFSTERARPFFDLLGQVQRDSVAVAVDLGCGTGELTRALAERWPQARVTGLDNSPQMLEKAARSEIPGRLSFVIGDIATWKAAEPCDLIFSNAALHWVGDHSGLLKSLAGMLAPDGTLAVQMPSRFQTPSQRAIEETVNGPRWQRLRGVGLHADSVRPLPWYVEQLHDLGFTVNAWETTYVHVLTGENPVLEWLKGTGLRPLLARLDPADTDDFLSELGARLRAAYPPTGSHTLFPFPRIFFVATRAT